jgi:hypothetical protein
MARPDIEITHFLPLVVPNRRRLACLAARQKGPSTWRDQNYLEVRRFVETAIFVCFQPWF